MPNSYNLDLRIEITFGEPTPLVKFANRIQQLCVPGIYLLLEGPNVPDKCDPTARDVVYIGKAIGETISSRCQKHLWTVTAATGSKGNPKTNPGAKFKTYREAISFNPDRLYVVPGIMSPDHPYLISCAEEYLLFEYRRRHGDIPPANTKE